MLISSLNECAGSSPEDQELRAECRRAAERGDRRRREEFRAHLAQRTHEQRELRHAVAASVLSKHPTFASPNGRAIPFAQPPSGDLPDAGTATQWPDLGHGLPRVGSQQSPPNAQSASSRHPAGSQKPDPTSRAAQEDQTDRREPERSPGWLVRPQERLPTAIQSLPTLALSVANSPAIHALPTFAGTAALERILMFAALGHDGWGRPHFALGLKLNERCWVRLALTALGRGRIAVSALLRGSDDEARPAIERLLEQIRGRGVILAHVRMEQDDAL